MFVIGNRVEKEEVVVGPSLEVFKDSLDGAWSNAGY